MQIDGFTFVAQLINFFVLLGLLYYYLYEPITRTMDQRRQAVNDRLEEARRKEEEARQEAEAHRRQRRQLDEQREQLLEEAREQAQQRRRELIEQTRDEIDDLKQRWEQDLRAEKELFLRELRRTAGEEIVELLDQALEQLADQSLEYRMVDVFARRLHELDDEDTRRIASSLEETDGGLHVRSAFDMTPGARDTIREAIRSRWGEIPVRFGVEEELICGVELEVGGRKIGWTLRDLLEEIGDRVSAALEEQPEEFSVSTRSPTREGSA